MPVLTAKQTAFLRALAQGSVPSEAYRIGFGHPKMRPWMRQSAHVLMRSAKMAGYVEAARGDYRRSLEAATEQAAAEQATREAALFTELGLSQERVVRELAAIAFAWPGESGGKPAAAVPMRAAEGAAADDLPSVRIQDKLAALGLLARMLGLFDKAKDKAGADNALNLTITIDGEETVRSGPGREAEQRGA